MLVLTNGTFQTQDNLLGSLGLLVENWFSLTTVTALFTIVTTFTLGEDGGFTGLVLGDLVGSVTSALFTSTKGLTSLRDVDLQSSMSVRERLRLRDKEIFGIIKNWLYKKLKMDGLVHQGLNSCYLPFQDSIGYHFTGVKPINSRN